MTDARQTVLIVNHNRTDACGVYQHGKRMVDILAGSERYRFVGVRCDSWEGFAAEVFHHQPSLCIYNYYPGTMDWVPDVRDFPLHVGMAHEVTHADAHTPRPPFARWIVTDPSFPDSDIYFRTVRPLPTYTPKRDTRMWLRDPKETPAIGSFGYAFPDKGFERVYDAVREEFGSSATLRYHVTLPHFDGGMGEAYLRYLKGLLSSLTETDPRRPRVELTTDHWDDQTLLDWLASNHLNCLFYDPNPGRGISSAVDWCVAAGRPLAVTESEQFRHILPESASGAYLSPWPEQSLRGALTVGGPAVKQLQQDWSHAAFIADYERIIDTLLGVGA